MADESKNKITIPDHKVLGRGLLRKLLRDAEITVEEFNKALKTRG
jgi:predicted RNA binding protein YcfA (HicA-like mRNA interferase family)